MAIDEALRLERSEIDVAVGVRRLGERRQIAATCCSCQVIHAQNPYGDLVE